MNKIYKKVWNKLRGCFVAVSEAMSSNQARGKVVAVAVGFVASAAMSFSANAEDIITSSHQRVEYTGGGTYGLLQLGGHGQDRSLPYKGNYEHSEVEEAIHESVTLNDGNWVFDAINNYYQDVRCTVSGRYKYFHISNKIYVNNSNVTSQSMYSRGLYQQIGGSASLGDISMDHSQGAQGGHSIDSHARGEIVLTDVDFSANSIAFNANDGSNTYTHTGGTGYIGSFTSNGDGMGTISLSDVDMTFGTITSAVDISALNGSITADVIDLTSQTLTGSNTDLTTGFDQVGNLTDLCQARHCCRRQRFGSGCDRRQCARHEAGLRRTQERIHRQRRLERRLDALQRVVLRNGGFADHRRHPFGFRFRR